MFEGSADFFHASVRDELITLTDPVLLITTTLNAPPSTHQGVKASLDALLWQSCAGPEDAKDGKRAKVHFVQVYD